MEDTKFVKARCKKTGKFFALEVKKFGLNWRVVNVDELSADKARLIVSEVKQGKFNANDNLLPCSVCGSRRMRINVVVTKEELDSFGSGGGF